MEKSPAQHRPNTGNKDGEEIAESGADLDPNRTASCGSQNKIVFLTGAYPCYNVLRIRAVRRLVR